MWCTFDCKNCPHGVWLYDDYFGCSLFDSKNFEKDKLKGGENNG